MAEPILSIVVIGSNEGARLVRCLRSILSMPRPFGEFEIVYVDSRSTDGSASRAAEFATVVELKDGRLSAARARNAGWQNCKGDFVFFLDGDTILHPDFLTKAMPEFEDPRVMVVCGNRREISPHSSVYNLVADLDWIASHGITDSCGGDAVIRRKVLEQTGGYNPDLIAGEEPDLCRRIRASGGLISHIDVPMTGHDFEMVSWRQYWKHAVRAGHAYAEVSAIYKNTADPLWREVSRRNAVQGVIYLAGSVLAVIASIVLHSWIFIALLLVAFGAIVVRTTLKARWRSPSLKTVALFAVHSHVQQIPILLGQARYWFNARGDWRSEVIDYKNM
jgi:cellulose synthase/poly-beta-1,6-N-acetylglucosamine synthase-like glycosyltransferase